MFYKDNMDKHSHELIISVVKDLVVYSNVTNLLNGYSVWNESASQFASHSPTDWQRATTQELTVRSNLGFNVVPKDAATSGREELGLNRQHCGQ